MTFPKSKDVKREFEILAEDYKLIRILFSRVRTGHAVSDRTKQKISLANKGKVSPNRGKLMTATQKLKLSKAHLGKKLSSEYKKAINRDNKGKKLSIQQVTAIGSSYQSWNKYKI